VINPNKKSTIIIIGGGFYGTMLALFLKQEYASVIIIEKESKILTKASYYNQARIHNGYHYPRSYITALSSHINFLKFASQFKSAVVSKYPSFYAIAKRNSKVSAKQFSLFCQQIGTPCKIASKEIKSFFNPELIEQVFAVKEYEFSGNELRKILIKKLKQSKIKVIKNQEVYSVSPGKNSSVDLQLKDLSTLNADIVFNCTYSQINTLLKRSKLPLIPLKFENTEMPLLQMPLPLRNYGITIMDGPFFSLLPFPDKKKHSLHHVRYTPLKSWRGVCNEEKQFNVNQTNFIYMKKDICRYIPSLKSIKSTESIYQTKTILEVNENNDGRPILFRKNYKIPNFHVVLGGKIDNVFDIIDEISSHGL